MQKDIIGWDIGGAHVKAAHLDAQGDLLQLWLVACPLWQGLDQLQAAVKAVLGELTVNNAQHVITMTGELVDLFTCRDEGVQAIIATMLDLLPEASVTVFAGAAGFMVAQDISPSHLPLIASANWLATAQFVAQQVDQGVLIDIGSTTSDILVFKGGSPCVLGFTDYDRLVSGELVYTGIIRTAVMAVAQQAFFNGQQQGLMAEYFATMADVYRVTGELNEAHDHTATADAAEKTTDASARRLSRLTGYDFCSEDRALWIQFAFYLRNEQLRILESKVLQQLSRNKLNTQSCFIGAGVGRFLVRQLAQRMGYAYQDFDDLIVANLSKTNLSAADCAPAVAVAKLYLEK